MLFDSIVKRVTGDGFADQITVITMACVHRPPLIALLFTLLMTTVGCGPHRAFRSVPGDLVEQARISGFPQVRTWADAIEPFFVESLVDSVRQEIAYFAAHPEQSRPDTVDLLALSGGGEDGAFSAGLICGWSERGDRPDFKVVTGVSTGALIAPFAFLGPDQDAVLREAYTTITDKDIAVFRGFLALLSRDGLADTDPLGRLIQRFITPEVLRSVAAEHAKGRRLLIATVNLEAQRPVVWNMGAIASSGHPRAIDLFRKVMLASASIPGAFEPQYFQVEVHGERFEEMHVDGGTMSQVFPWGAGMDLVGTAAQLGIQGSRRPGRLFVVRNGRFHPEHKPLRSLFVDIAGRSLSTLIKAQGIGDMYRLYTVAQAYGMEYNQVAIPPTFQVKATGAVDQEYMSALFQFGYNQARQNMTWQHEPPYLQAITSQQH